MDEPTQHEQPATQPPPSPSAPTPPENRGRARSGPSIARLAIGCIILITGLSLLAQNLGWDWIPAVAWWQFWPVVVILIGISILGGGRWGRLWSVLVVIAIVALATLAIVQPRGSREEVSRDVAIPRTEGVSALSLRLETGFSDVDIRGGASGFLDGSFTSNVADLTTTSTLTDGVQHVTLASQGHDLRSWWLFGKHRNDFDLRVANDLPLDLTVESGAATLELDLRDVQVRDVDIDTGASTVTLDLGAALAKTTVHVDAGATTISIRLPSDAGARVTLDAGATTKTLPDFHEVGDDVFETDNYATATRTVDLTLTLGASTLNISRR